MLLLSRLGLHLLHLDGVALTPAHVQFMVPHAQLQNALVDTQSRGIKYEVLKNKNKIPKWDNLSVSDVSHSHRVNYAFTHILWC